MYTISWNEGYTDEILVNCSCLRSPNDAEDAVRRSSRVKGNIEAGSEMDR